LAILDLDLRGGAVACAVVAMLLGGCTRQVRPTSEAPRRENAVGLASWYGGRLHGRRTASGERFDKHALTAAHRTLPLGSCVQVANLENGRRVQVRINDRGPQARDRIIDLSEAAARELGMLGRGVARVSVQSCGR
jgi:rare lipoprotein A